jgi:glycerol-3-phosphate O-acyltransferase/dihydroxyacetone phosphate acyltransferase
MRPLADRVMTSLARLLMRLFFRRVELEHAHNLPPTGPVVVVANHTNGLVDGLLLIAMLSRYPRFLGKSTLFRIPPLWPFLKLAGVIPVHRAIDGGRSGQNTSAFATSHRILAHGDVVALFPEGISHDASSLQPLRTGAARIALEAGLDQRGAEVMTVAVGLTYDAKARFRSRALVRIGPPEGLARWTEAYGRDSHDAVRQLTMDLADRLSLVNPGYSSWEQAGRLSRLAEVVVRGTQPSPTPDVALADRAEMADRLAERERSDPTDPDLREVLAAAAAYERDLTLLGLSDAQVAADYGPGHLRATVVWSALKILVAFPLAALGVVIHIVPFQLIKALAQRPTNEGIKATVKLLGSLVAFIVVYATLGFVVGRAFGAWTGLLVALAAPLCGYVTVRLAERAQRVGGVLEGYRALRDQRADLAGVLQRRSSLIDATRQVLGA